MYGTNPFIYGGSLSNGDLLQSSKALFKRIRRRPLNHRIRVCGQFADDYYSISFLKNTFILTHHVLTKLYLICYKNPWYMSSYDFMIIARKSDWIQS